MDSINVVKGYGKVNGNHVEDEEDQVPKPHPKPKTTFVRLVVISAVVLLSLLIGSLLGALLLHESTTESSRESPSLSAKSVLRTVCNATRFPDSCFSSISALNGSPETDPEVIFKLSLRVSIAELSKLSSSLKAMSLEEAALRDCLGQVEDALSQLNDSVSAMEVGPGEKVLTEAKIRDVQTWISGAVTDQETCLDGLQETQSTPLDEVKKKMQRSNEYTSNSLAIVANIHTILDNLHMPLH